MVVEIVNHVRRTQERISQNHRLIPGIFELQATSLGAVGKMVVVRRTHKGANGNRDLGAVGAAKPKG